MRYKKAESDENKNFVYERGQFSPHIGLSNTASYYGLRPCSGKIQATLQQDPNDFLAKNICPRMVGQIIAGIIVLIRPRIGGYIVMAWLIVIAITLVAGGAYYHVAVRDLVMAVGAFSLARLSAERAPA